MWTANKAITFAILPSWNNLKAMTVQLLIQAANKLAMSAGVLLKPRAYSPQSIEILIVFNSIILLLFTCWNIIPSCPKFSQFAPRFSQNATIKSASTVFGLLQHNFRNSRCKKYEITIRLKLESAIIYYCEIFLLHYWPSKLST